jgi:hypothetical protein
VECWLLNARHVNAVPGRKTDVKDAEWIAELVEHGLVMPSFVPPEPIRQLPDLTCYRAEIVRQRTREVQPPEKLWRTPRSSSTSERIGAASLTSAVNPACAMSAAAPS